MRTKILEAVNITVIYPNGVRANDNISISVNEGEILGLLGENGAGKTTLVKVISGIIKPTKGEILLYGKEVEFNSYRDALRSGIYYLSQNPQLIEGLTVLEDIGLTLTLAGKSMSRGSIEQYVASIASKYNLKVDLKALSDNLSVGERQRIELIKPILLDSKIIILDEPTTHMSPLEIESLYSMLRDLAGKGKSIIFITHKIREATSVSDRIIVMRKGKISGIIERDKFDREVLLNLMFGSNNTINKLGLRYAKPREYKSNILEVRELWVKGDYGDLALRGINLSVGTSEIVGVAGIAGNGQRELFETLVGLRKPIRGSIIFNNVDVTSYSPRDRIKLGLAIVPEDRLGWALVPGLNIVSNIIFALTNVDSTLKSYIIDWGMAWRIAKEALEIVPIQADSLNTSVESLSGGNMQRLILARELSRKPRLIIAMNPTSGLDYVTSINVKQVLIDYASRGVGILLISEDLDELIEVSDRVLVMNRGAIVGEFMRPYSLENIAKLMIS